MDCTQRIPDGLSEFISNNDLHVEIIESSEKPSCLSYFLGQETSNKVFYLVSKPNLENPPLSPEIIVSHDSSNFSDTSDKSVIGSPLKLLAIANLSSINFSTSSPVAVNEHKKQKSNQFSLHLARKLLNKYISVLPLDPNPIPMLCALCDGEDRQHTVLIGAMKEVRDNRLFIKNFIVTSGKTNLASLDKSFSNSGKYQMKCHHKLLDSNDGLGSVVLEADWSDQSGKVKIHHLNSALFILHVGVTVGSDQNPVHSHYCTLQKVNVFIDGLKSGELPALLTNNPIDASRKLQDLFDKIKAGLIDVQNASDNHGFLSGVTKKLKLEPRSDLDFTDLLWTILCQCATFKDIVHCLRMTLMELRKGELQFFVHVDNQTTFAKLVRQSYSGNATLPTLTGRFPVLIMAELGLEYIRKNYFAIFMDNNLCTKEEWIAFVSALAPINSEVMDMEELGIRISLNFLDVVSKLHHVLELVTVVDAFTEDQDLHTMTQKVMNFYKTDILDTCWLTFSFPITALRASREMNRIFNELLQKGMGQWRHIGRGKCFF
ncbi:hypothetical protein Btru_058768 [Bulinus truncatus]|nr:hypothetical protein Btru_058768 [Bulinus truncatus]